MERFLGVFNEAAASEARVELTRRLEGVRARIADAGLEPDVIDEAITAARRRPKLTES